MSTLYLRLPAHASIEGLAPGTPLYCPYALVSEGNRIERDGVAALSSLGEAVKRARSVVLLLAASDVTLLRVKMPPLSGARLKAALPNLVEEHLMSDPADCVVVAGEMHGGLRTVAVVQRNWLEILTRTLLALGARKISALPSQLCQPLQGDAAVACVAEHGNEVDLTLRSGVQEGIGLAIVADQPESAAFEVIQSLAALVPQAPLVLYVPPGRLRDYQGSLHLVPALEQRIALHEDNWTRWIAGAAQAGPDMMSGLAGGGSARVDLKRWKWPALLALGLLLINLIGLNTDWLRMQREAEALRNGMLQTYRSAFPQDTVIVDPLAQARQKAAAVRNAGGELAADDFLALTAALAEAWSGAGGRGAAPIAALDYRDRVLTVRFKPNAGIDSGALNAALAARNLTVSEQGEASWQIRSGR